MVRTGPPRKTIPAGSGGWVAVVAATDVVVTAAVVAVVTATAAAVMVVGAGSAVVVTGEIEPGVPA
jgi:hypothetical protein